MKGSYTIGLLLFPFLLLSGFSKNSRGKQSLPDYYYWAALYNDSTLFDSNRNYDIKWAYTIHRRDIKPGDSISLILRPDCCVDLNPAILIKDSTGTNTFRRFELTEKLALKDILPYAAKLGNKCLLLYTEKDKEKDGTIVWDNERTYPRRYGYARLLLTIVE